MLTATLILSLAATTPSVAQEIACPDELAASAVTVTHAPTGWTGFVPTKLMLHAVGVSLGRLEDRATLIGDYRKLARGAYTVTFSLREAGNDERWLMCQYGDSNDIVIAKRLLQTVDSCVISYTPDKYGDKTIKIACK
jgi:hypothetical protein